MNDKNRIEVVETAWIPMPDGVRLAARIWLPPEAKNSKVPAILEYIPYRRRDRTRMRDESMHPHFAAAGYASLRVDMRGSGDSGGIMEDEYSHQEIQDGKDVIAWIAEQDWSDGKVGMFGKSWGAYTSFQVAALNPPALKAIAPVMGTDDRWLEDIHFYGGVLANDNFWWGSVMQLYNSAPPDPEIVGEDNWKEIWKNRLESMTFWPAQWLEHQTRDEMWRRGSISENYSDVDIPVYFFGGWADLFRDTPFRIAQNLKGPVKVLMGPWAHLYPHEASPGPKMDFMSEVIRFWNHWLKGEDTGLMDEPRLRFWICEHVPPTGTCEVRPGRWVELSDWPSESVKNSTMWLGECGTGLRKLGEKPEIGSELSVCSPQDYGISGGEMCSFAIPGDMPADAKDDAAGALRFESDKLSEPMDILGQPSVRLQLSSDRPQAFVSAVLMDEAEDGSLLLISRGFCNLMHLEDDINPKPVVPGRKMSITVPLHGVGYRISEGHRLVLLIASTYWPVLWPSPEPVTLTVFTENSSLTLPTLANQADSVEMRDLPQPPPAADTRRMTKVKEGALERGNSVESKEDGEYVTQRVFIDGGVFGPVGRIRLDETGTVIGDVSERIYEIERSDPLKAKATMTQESIMEREDWNVRIKTYSEQTATKTHFLLKANVKCWIGDELFHESDWNHEIPRNGM